jgi:ABC-2 type transport system permease protein
VTLRPRSGQAGFAWYRVIAVARKDAVELLRNPGAILPAVAMVFAALFPAFLVLVGVPLMIGESPAEDGEFMEAAQNAIGVLPGLAGLAGPALAQAFIFHQFALLLMLVPIVASMALASHAVVGEKQSKALEPILATPISTLELLLAKVLTPFLFTLVLTWVTVGIYLLGVVVIGEPGVREAVFGARLLIMFAVLGPLVEVAALLVAVIVSSRSNDPRSAQQIGGLMVLPLTAVFVGQLMGLILVGPAVMLLASAGCIVLNAILLWIGVRVFERETILTRWR